MDQHPTQRPTSALTLAGVRRNWPVVVALLVLGALVGIGSTLVRPATYTGEVRLAVGNGEMSSLNIPGFPTASAQMASNYARWVTRQQVAGVNLPEGTLSLAASPLPESNVLRVEATSHDPDVAVRAAAAAAEGLAAEVNKVATGNDPEVLLGQIRAANADVALKKVAADVAENTLRDGINQGLSDGALTGLRSTFTAASDASLEASTRQAAMIDRYRRLVSQSSTEATLVTLGEGATLTGNDRVSSAQRAGLVGLAAGALAAMAWVWVREARRDPRRAHDVTATDGAIEA